MANKNVDITVRGIDKSGPASSALGKLESQVKSFKGIAATALGGFGLASVVGGALQAFAEQEQASAKLAQAFKSTGNAAGFAAVEIEAFASMRQNITTFADEATTAAAAVLATFTSIKGEAFKGALIAAQDLSAAMGQDLQQSVVQLGKALNDPIRGVSALQEVGVSFTQTQKDTIAKLVSTNNVLGAQRLILAELKTEFGGMAEAVANTTSGSLAQFKNSMSSIAETIGGALAPVMAKLASSLTAVKMAAESAGEAMGKAFGGGGVNAPTGDSVGTMKDAMDQSVPALMRLGRAFARQQQADASPIKTGIGRGLFGAIAGDFFKKPKQSGGGGEAGGGGISSWLAPLLPTLIGPEKESDLMFNLRTRLAEPARGIGGVFNRAFGALGGEAAAIAAPTANNSPTQAFQSNSVRFGFAAGGGAGDPVVKAVNEQKNAVVKKLDDVAARVAAAVGRGFKVQAIN